MVELLSPEQVGKPIADATSMQRYSTEAMNVISAGPDKLATDAAGAAQGRASTTIGVQSTADDIDLSMLVVRGPFNMVRQRSSAALERVGMKVIDSTRSQGNMAVTCKPLSDSEWHELGASDPGPTSGDYKLQAGDLDNHSSLQLIDPRGHTLIQSQNSALVAIFQVAFNK